MNISYSVPTHLVAHTQVGQLGDELIRATTFMLIPTELLYFSIYFHIKGARRTYQILTLLSVATFGIAPVFASISCGPLRCLQKLGVAIGTMKLLDVMAGRHSLRVYTAGKRPADHILAFITMTELRYESFTPNQIRVSKNQEKFSEPLQLAIHVAVFCILQALPQNYNTVLAFEVQLSIYIIWTCMQLSVRYKSSPALFGPLYLADSLTGFWSETWHNAFASPCTSLAYNPLRYGLPKYGVPVVVARSLGVLGAFSLMAMFHIYALDPILSQEGLYRVGMFFFLNGVATVFEACIWGKKRHWVKAVLAWAFQAVVASWTAAGMDIPNGISRIRWGELCDAPKYY